MSNKAQKKASSQRPEAPQFCDVQTCTQCTGNITALFEVMAIFFFLYCDLENMKNDVYLHLNAV